MALGKAIPYNIAIEPSNNQGFIMTIGCGHFVYANKESLQVGLARYLNDWKAVTKSILKLVEALQKGKKRRPHHRICRL